MDTIRLRLDLAYDGTDFHGWAKQKDGLRTVQGVLEEKLALIAQAPAELTVAGRTDAGVHASGQVAHVDLPRAIMDHRSIMGDPSRLVLRMAKMLPADIRLHGVSVAPPGFDARFSALRRHYVYRVTTAPAGPLPLRARDTAAYNRPVEVGLLQEAAEVLIGLHDFAAFCKQRPHATTIRDLQQFQWREVSTAAEPELYEAHVTADAFCWSMVRSLVGCCLAIGAGRQPVSFAADLLALAGRGSQCPVAPAAGLTLTQVDYPADGVMGERALTTRARREL